MPGLRPRAHDSERGPGPLVRIETELANVPSEKPRLALLIDADNVSSKYLPVIMNEIPKHGIATYRRIYGDFTDQQMASWRQKLLDNSITPVQQFSNIKSHKPGEKAGKNATDSTLIIDAMDILYEGKVDGFIIVSSDSDFTRLASRLRESNMIVVGMGRNQTAISFRHACTKFVNIEYLYELEHGRDESARKQNAKQPDSDEVETTVTLEDVSNVVGGVIRDNENKGRRTPLSDIGNSLSNKFPDFDVRSFGYSQLSKLIEDMDRYVLVKTDVGYDVVMPDKTDTTKNVAQFIVHEVGKHQDKGMYLSSLATSIYDKFPDFDVKDTGYSQFYKFVNSIKGVKVTGGQHKQVKLDR